MVGSAYWRTEVRALGNEASPPTILTPADGAVVTPAQFEPTWNAVAGATGYFIELTNVTTEQKLSADLDASQKSFAVPETWLAPGTEYEVVVAARASNGNLAGVVVFATTR